eukprot:1803864-Pleurochrysis_carterae.AAC.4
MHARAHPCVHLLGSRTNASSKHLRASSTAPALFAARPCAASARAAAQSGPRRHASDAPMSPMWRRKHAGDACGNDAGGDSSGDSRDDLEDNSGDDAADDDGNIAGDEPNDGTG